LTRIIGVVSGKGGVGKTTIVVNLGAALALKFKRDVVIVDCNITTSHLGMYLGMYYYPASLNQVLSGEIDIEKAMYDYSIPGLRIIPASLSLEDLKGIDVSELKASIKNLSGKADIVLLDAAPGFGKEALAALKASEEMLYVMTPFVPSLMDVVKCHQLAEQFGVKSLGIILNMTGEGRHELSIKEIEQLTELPVIAKIPRDKNILKSLSEKIPVIDLKPNSPASREFKKLAANLIGQDYTEGVISRIVRFFRRGRPERIEFQIKTGVKPNVM